MTDPSKPPSGRRMKAHAPPPPQVPQPAPRHIFRSTTPDGGGTPGMDTTENILKPTVEITLTLPQGYQTSIIEDGSKALMDLLVELCSRYHLNPALHTLELVSPEGHSVGFKPNALLGSLNVAAVLIKEKVWEEKVRRPAPKVPEKSVRLMVNYHGSQKAVVRVNPLVPLQVLIPVICDKCEFEAAHVLLLKDSISRHELPLDKSLAELGIKELYVHDQSLVHQPKMASAPALNYTEDPVYSSTASLGRPGKKGFLGIFQFSRRKSKTESTSQDMDDCDGRIIKNTDTQSDVLSTVSGIPCLEDQTVTLGQSQSVTSIPSMSLKAETKKRRAPAPPGAPTPTMGHASYEGFQMGLGSESQLRKRKAPAPPSTPTSDTLGSDDASASDAPTPDSCDTETPTPALFTRVAQSVTVVSAPTVVAQQAKLDPLKIAVQPLRVCDDGPNRSSPTPSSSTADSLTVQDSSSELSHSINDSDTDLDQAGSRCSTLTSSSESGSARVQTTTTTTRFSTKVEESASGTTVRVNQEVASDSSSRSETESALNLKLEEVENNRHSAIGNSDRPVPPKPRRSPAREPPQPVKPPTLPTLHSPFPPIESTESNHPQNFMEVEDAAPQSWLHSMQSGQKPLPEAPEDETLSLGRSSSGASSLPDQGYAASEGMAEGEDSGMVSSPSDTQPTSPDGSLSLDGNSRERGEKLRGPPRDSSSDSDEGCATWRSIHRHNDISPQAESARLKKSYEDDNELTAQLHQTLADFEADPAGHVDVVSAKDTWYTTSRDSNDVPVSVVDMDVPVTAIDEVIEEYERHNVEHETKLLNRTESASSRGSDFKHKSNVEPQNKNNNACTAAVSDKKSIATMKQSSQLEQHSKPQENKFISVEKGEKIIETKKKKTVVADANRVKENKPAVAAKSNVDTNSKSTEVCSEKGADRPSQSQRSVSAKQDEDMYKVYQTNSGLSTAQGKITRNVTSRFGMKTFTVVPPKPAVIHAAAEQPAVRSTAGAIRIDDQGNMVTAGIAWNKVDGSSESETNSSKVSPLLGKAKAFWSSNERHDSVHSKSPSESESKNSLKNYSAALVETQIKNRSMEELKTTQSALSKTTERIQLEKVVKEEFDEPEDEVKVSKEEQQVEGESKISKSFQLPSNKPVLPPPLLPDLKRDLSFLKPSRRTSSQYVASAINKYAPKSSAQPTSIPKTPDYSTGLQRSGRSIQVNPHQSSQSFFSDNKENVTVFTSKPSGPIRSMSYPEYVSDSQRDFEEERRDRGGFENKVASTKETLDRLEGQSANNNYIQSSGSTQIKVTTHNDVENIKHIRPRSPSPATIRPFHSSTKPPTAPKIISQTLTNSSDDTTKTATHRSSITRPQPSVTVSDSSVTPGPPAVTLFGPITKFRPVIHKAVEKETSLHTSLMEAIQTGGGRGRLKKTSTSSPSSVTKVSCMEEESERSALLAAVRAQSSSSKLRKTKSEAADELEKFRKEASEEQRNLGPSSPSLTCTSPVSNPPPPPPPAPTVAPHHPPPPPPPPPPVLPQAKSCSVAHPSTNASMNPSLAREAMLEAIRSGSAAEKLKKVAAPTKTLQVNGRLGTIQPTSSTSIPQ